MKPFIFALLIPFMLIAIHDCKGGSKPGHSQPSALSSSGIPPIPDFLKQKIARYQDWNYSSFVDWAPDGNGVIALRRSKETSQLYYIAKPNGYPRRLTSLNESVLNATVCPDTLRKCVLFNLDSGGNEQFQIYALDLNSLHQSRLTKDNAQNSGMVWSNRGDRFAYSSNRRNGLDFDIYLATTDRPGRDSLVLSKGGAWSIIDWSPDDRKLLVQRYVSRTFSLLFILDCDRGSLMSLIDSGDTVSQELGAWGPDTMGVFFTSDQYTDYRCLCYVDCTAKKTRVITASLPWDVREISLSKDRGLLAFSTNEDGFSQLYLMDSHTFKYRKFECLPRGIVSQLSFHPSGKFLAMTVNTPNQPDEVYSIDLTKRFVLTNMTVKSDSNSTLLSKSCFAKRWTQSDLCGLNSISFVQPQLVHYPTFDSVSGKPRLIPCLVCKPLHGKTPFPVLISIHGGPESQYWPSFKPDVQFLIGELGIAVVAPNVRGSGGYGKTWLSLDNGYKREDAVRDIGCLLDWIVKQPDLDSSRIAVTGGSYGGYMALASMAHFGKRIGAGIDHYGISNFVTFLERTALYRRDLRRVEYGDERDSVMRKFLLEISPVNQANHINNPLLIIQGKNDARVPLEESQQIADALRKKGNVVWFLVAEDEGHGYRKKSNRDYAECVSALFLGRFLVR